MIIQIRVFNAWERENWSYLINPMAQSSFVLNKLYSFMKLANEYFTISYEAAKEDQRDAIRPAGILGAFMSRRPVIFAAERYTIDFWDDYQYVAEDIINLYRTDTGKIRSSTTIRAKDTGYKHSNIALDNVISPRMIAAAVNGFAKKTFAAKENILYKRFDEVFLKKRSKEIAPETSSAQIFQEAQNILLKLFPPKKRGENKDVSRLHDIIQELHTRVNDLPLISKSTV